MTNKANKRGRPEMKNQISMRKEIMRYYEGNISAATAARETNYDIKTIYKYYNAFSKVALESQNIDFVQQKNLKTTQLIATYDHMILGLQNILKNTIKEMSNIPILKKMDYTQFYINFSQYQ